MTSKDKGQGNKVMLSVWYMFTSRMKSRRNTKIGRKVVRATADIRTKFHGQKVKGQGHQGALGGYSSYHL